MSLRARLLLILLTLAAAGLAILGFASYAALRSYLSDRVDQQATSAIGPVTHVLLEKALSPPAGGPGAVGPGSPLIPPGSSPLHPPDAGDNEPGALPPGTYGAIISPSGDVIAKQRFSYGESALPRPAIGLFTPAAAPAPGQIQTFTASAGDDSPTQFRVAVASPPGARVTVIAAVPLTDFEQTLSHLRLVELVVSAAVLAALAALGLYVIRLGLRPLERMEGTARAIAAGDLSQRVESTDERTEVGRLGAALNEMLHRIERAFAEREASEGRLRTFLADASHELRTPLASIRGYAELHRMGAASEPADVEQAMRKIEEESTRMGTLVQDLLALARLDEVPEPTRQSLDLAGLAAACCDDARAAAPDRVISLDGAGPLMVEGDPAQLRSVLANLLANALRHTPRGTPVEVSVAAIGHEARIAVRDHGPGLAPGDEEHVFERFWRHGEGRGRADGGAGLGLAIVAAVANAHHGRATASNAAGGGALFQVFLPWADEGDERREERRPE